MTTREELIIECMPFSDELREWCKAHPEFADALKVIRANRFVALGVVYTSYSPFYPEDQVIGFLVYDYRDKEFKQDFIVSLGGRNKVFIAYTRVPGSQPSKYVKDINEFYSKYGRGKYYLDTHHLDFDQLDERIKFRAKQAINLAERVVKYGLVELRPEELELKKAEIIKIKQENDHDVSS